MNKRQKTVLAVVAVLFLLSMVFVPWYGSFERRLFNGYAFIAAPPRGSAVDINIILMEWVVISVAGGIAVFLLKEESS